MWATFSDQSASLIKCIYDTKSGFVNDGNSSQLGQMSSPPLFWHRMDKLVDKLVDSSVKYWWGKPSRWSLVGFTCFKTPPFPARNPHVGK